MNALPESMTVRGYQLPDFDRHAKWLLPRLLEAYPHLDRRSAINFLKGLLSSNEYHILYLPHGIAVAQLVFGHTLAPKPVVQERFVWVENREDKNQIEQAVGFYDAFKQWAKSLRCETIIVEEMSDVPHEMIKAKLGRIFSRQQQFARL